MILFLDFMDSFFDPMTQVGNPTLLLLERLFWGGLAIFLFGAISTGIKRGLKDGRGTNRD